MDEPTLERDHREIRAGDPVIFQLHIAGGSYELTGILITRPYPDRTYLSVRTKRNDYAIPTDDILRRAD